MTGAGGKLGGEFGGGGGGGRTCKRHAQGPEATLRGGGQDGVQLAADWHDAEVAEVRHARAVEVRVREAPHEAIRGAVAAEVLELHIRHGSRGVRAQPQRAEWHLAAPTPQPVRPVRERDRRHSPLSCPFALSVAPVPTHPDRAYCKLVRIWPLQVAVLPPLPPSTLVPVRPAALSCLAPALPGSGCRSRSPGRRSR